MTDKDLYRLGIIQRVHDHTLLQREAARLLELTVRQVQRVLRRYREHGAASIVSARRGRPGNNRIPEDLRSAALQLIRQHYADFGPTLATEKLLERHGIPVSVETVRNWMISDGLWRPHSRRQVNIYQPRHRRDCLGELVQLDGSHHAWFEDRAPKCCLLVYVDDATGRLMHLRFCDSESAFDYMTATREYIDLHGKPVAFYSDKHAVFRVNATDARRSGTTQFGRALRDLSIELICANSSQAKGRVERANQTLQDRLVKELRLHNICSIGEANRWVAGFIDDFNRRFAHPPKYPKDLHRPAGLTPDELDDIFAWQEQRKLSKALTFQYDKILYLIEPSDANTRIAGEKITVFEYPDGRISFRYAHRELRYQVFDKLACVDQGEIVDNKRLGTVLRLAQEKQNALEAEGKRSRSRKMPRRRAQERAPEALRAINSVLVSPEDSNADALPLSASADTTPQGGKMSQEKKVMTLQEQLRADLIEMYLAGDITAAEAAQSMEVSPRQCRRLVSRYRESGRNGMVDLRRGKPSNYQLKEELKPQVVQLIRIRCRGMSPTGAWRLLAT